MLTPSCYIPLSPSLAAIGSYSQLITSTLSSLGQHDPSTNLILAGLEFGESVTAKNSLLLNAKKKYHLDQRPNLVTLVYIDWDSLLQLEGAFLGYDNDYFPNLLRCAQAELPSSAIDVLFNEAKRRGPALAIGRLLQALSLSPRVVLISNDTRGDWHFFHYDLAGVNSFGPVHSIDHAANELAKRIVIATSAKEAKNHIVSKERFPLERWERLTSVRRMNEVGPKLAALDFFAAPFDIEKLVGKTAIGEVLSSQYSEGCYSIFDHEISGMITSGSGSYRLIDKRQLCSTDQTVVAGLTPERDGVEIVPIAGAENTSPSTEAVEMYSIYMATQNEKSDISPAISILHGHVEIQKFDPAIIEQVTLPEEFLSYPVSCGTIPLARATAAAFAKSETLRNIDDPREVVFVEQPGHGVVICEKRFSLSQIPFNLTLKSLERGLLSFSPYRSSIFGS